MVPIAPLAPPAQRPVWMQKNAAPAVVIMLWVVCVPTKFPYLSCTVTVTISFGVGASVNPWSPILVAEMSCPFCSDKTKNPARPLASTERVATTTRYLL